MDKDTQSKVQALNASWRQYLTDKMIGKDDGTFKLAQGSLGLQTTDSSGLFLMADAVPPALSVFDAGGTNSFSSNYTNLLEALLPESGTDLKGELGDNYSNWIDFRNAYFKENPTSTKTQEQIFEVFANQRLDPRLAQKAISTFKAAAQSPLNGAFDANIAPDNSETFTDSSGQKRTLRKYTPTIGSAKSELNTGTSLSLEFNSKKVESTLKETQIAAAASGFYDIFSGGASGSFDQLNSKAASSGFTITGYINKYKTLAVERGGWFTSGEYNRAYNGKNDNTIWDPQANAGDWNAFFAQPNGGLARRVTQLLLVTDYKITVTSEATYSQEDYKKITSEAKFGIWPFFSASASYSHTMDSKLNSDSHLETTFTLNKGLIQIWGVTVENAPR